MLSQFMCLSSDGCDDPPECPSEGFLGVNCTCWCPASPIKPCPGKLQHFTICLTMRAFLLIIL